MVTGHQFCLLSRNLLLRLQYLLYNMQVSDLQQEMLMSYLDHSHHRDQMQTILDWRVAMLRRTSEARKRCHTAT